jgi:nitrite reductase/ring-hydroxylating ferredoxin subunit/uncharacterized membrane protein
VTQELLGRRLASRLALLDKLADVVQPRLQRTLSSSMPVRNLLDGTWLRTPLHPVLTDIPVGAATTAFVLDLAAVAGRSSDLARNADRVLRIAVLAAVPAAVTGAADWRDLNGETRRIGTLHALVNSAALVLNLRSLVLRARGRQRAGRVASGTALLATSLAAHIGGELSFGLGVRVNRTAFDNAPDEFTPVAERSEVDDNEFHRVEVDGTPVLVTRSADGTFCAIAATCSHLGGPLDEGARDGDTVTCPWHASRFDLRTGAVLDGPSVFAQPSYEVRERDGKLELRAARHSMS